MIVNLAAGAATMLIDRRLLPDALIRAGIRSLCRHRLRSLEIVDEMDRRRARASFIERMHDGPIAPRPEMANEQHYEVPPAFYAHVLGKHRKYSSCYFEHPEMTLDEAEAAALRHTVERAQLEDGQRILELGCGWGSLTMWMATMFPHARITAVSNASSQRAYIEEQLELRGLRNVRVITADMNDFDIDERFDRVVSVEMFEHMRNYRALLERINGWLSPGGMLFVHIFCHRGLPYTFETTGAANWMGRHFFTGGIMPSDDIFRFFRSQVTVQEQWYWNGLHYAKTADAWLHNLDAHRNEIMPILRKTYGKRDASTWFARWRVFFMACAELFGFDDGRTWGVGHYLLRPSATVTRTILAAPNVRTSKESTSQSQNPAACPTE